jgi:hypothetical protein
MALESMDVEERPYRFRSCNNRVKDFAAFRAFKITMGRLAVLFGQPEPNVIPKLRLHGQVAGFYCLGMQ